MCDKNQNFIGLIMIKELLMHYVTKILYPPLSTGSAKKDCSKTSQND